jgi:hypothetical protein
MQIFKREGKILEVKIKHKTHEKYAFVNFEREDEALSAIQKYLSKLTLVSTAQTSSATKSGVKWPWETKKKRNALIAAKSVTSPSSVEVII